MKAIQIQTFGGPEVLQVADVPTPQAGPGEVRIKVSAASVNYSDIMRRSNATYPFPTPLPFIPGGEVAGIIDAQGEGVTQPAVGTPVFALLGGGANGYAQFALAPAEQVVPIPEDLSPQEAVSLPIAGTTALLLLRETAGLQAGESVLIEGAAGGVGSYAIQIAKALGAGTVIGATSRDDKFEAVLSNGADHAINYTHDDWGQQVRDLTGGNGVDVLLEMRGGTSFAQGLNSLAPFGRVVVYGMASGQPLVFDDDAILRTFYDPSPNQSIHVFNLGLWLGLRTEQYTAALGDLVGMVAAGQVSVQVDAILPLAQAADAHQRMANRQSRGKLILDPWATS